MSVAASGESSDTGTGASYDLQGSNNSLSLGQNSSVEIDSGNDNVVNNDNAGDTVNLDSNTGATINGSAGTIGLDGTGITAYTSNETLNLQSGDSTNAYGSGDTANLYGIKDVFDIYSGGNNTVIANDGSDVVSVGGDSTSDNDTIIASNDPNLVAISGGSVSVNGNNNTVSGQGAPLPLQHAAQIRFGPADVFVPSSEPARLLGDGTH